MTAEARWIASAAASALYWTKCRLAQPAATPPLAPQVADAADALARELDDANLDPPAFFAHALPLCVHVDTPRSLADRVLTKLHGPSRATSGEAIAREIAAIYREFQQYAPGLVNELELRTGPLREQWEARGPGVLAMLRRLTEPDVAPDSAELILVRPVRGGGGEAYPLYNTLLVEAVLANPVAELPEVVRLAWLWAQLGFDLPKYSDALGHARLAVVGRLALLPAVLAAAEEVELTRLAPPTFALALDTWEIAGNDAPAGSLAELLLDWWTTYQQSRTPWPVALAALDQLLTRSSTDG